VLPDISEIKKERTSLGIKQKQLAKLAGVSQSLIAKLESGKIDPSYSKVRRIFEVLRNVKQSEQKTAKEIMTKTIIAASPSENLKEIVIRMKAANISQAPVIANNMQVGSLSDQTIVNAINKYGIRYDSLKVRDVMDPGLPIVEEGSPIESIKSLLKFSPAILVSKNGKIVGIISRSNLF
jgi:predicted transcriptional regulator